jgi:hypothetical protein
MRITGMQNTAGDVRLHNGPIMLTFRGLGRYRGCSGGRRVSQNRPAWHNRCGYWLFVLWI